MSTLEDLTKKEQRLIAADFAEHVLPLFEAKHPDDERPRKAIEAARAFARGEITKEQLADARAAAGAAARSAAGAAARAAGDAAWAAARDAAWDAAGAAAWDAAGAAAWDAAWDAERAWQQQRIDEVVAARIAEARAVQEAPDVAEARAEVSRQENAYARACITAGSTIPSTDALDRALDAYAAAVRGEAKR